MALQLWFPLTENLSNYGIYSCGAANVPATCTINNIGKLGKCYVNTGGSVIDTNINITTLSWTLCCWARLDTKTGNWASAIGLNGSQTSYIGLGCQNKNNTTIGFHYYSKSSGSNTAIFDSYCIPETTLNEWIHYALSYNGTNYYVYVNGVLIQTAAANRSETNTFTKIKLFGSQSGVFKGALNDVRFYDECLSQQQIKKISKGLFCHYLLTPNFSPTILPSGYTKVDYLIFDEGEFFDTGYTFNAEIDGYDITYKASNTSHNGMPLASDGNRHTWVYYYGSNKMQVYTNNASGSQITTGALHLNDLLKHNLKYKNKKFYVDGSYKTQYTDSFISDNATLKLGRYTATYAFKGNIYECKIYSNNELIRWYIPCYNSSNVYGYYDIVNKEFKTTSVGTWAGGNDSAGLIEYDVSGFNNNLIITQDKSIMFNNSSPRYTGCYKFNNGYLYKDDFNITTDTFTFSFWMNKNVTTATHQHFILGTFSTWTSQGFGMWRETGSGYTMLVKPNNIAYKTFGTAINDLKWHHIGIVYNGSNLFWYMDGILKSTTTFDTTNPVLHNNLTIGNSKFQSRPANETDESSMVDFKMYVTALSAEDIKELYETSMEIDVSGNIIPRILS